MGLQDILTGMMNGPRGQPQPSSGGSSSGGGMSPLVMALLGLLAYKAFKGSGGQAPQQAPYPQGGNPQGYPQGGGNMQTGGGGLGDLLGGLFGGGGRPGAMPGGMPQGMPQGGRPGGSLADMIPGGLGGLLGGAAAGTVLSGGLDNLIKGFQQSGQGRVAQSWVNRGQNEDIAPGDLESALGADTIDALSRQTGMGRDELLGGLSQQLPHFVDQLTPDGRLPTEDEAQRLV
jgi:uncharacterized protein YidB (DUF937 family)